jgi:poly(3-hydroxybutyrate) depolymerase
VLPEKESMARKSWFEGAPWAALLVAAACSSPTNGSHSVSSGSSSGGAASGNSGTPSGTTGAPGGSGVIGSGTVSSGVDNSSGTVSSGVGGSGTGGSGTSTGTAGATTGTAGTGASGSTLGSGATTGAATSGSTGYAGGAGFPTDKSAGCGTAPGADTSNNFTIHDIDIPACGATITQECVAPSFVPGGVAAQSNGGYTFIHRNFALELPGNYQTTVAYPVVLGGGGCGGGPVNNGNGFGLNETGAIEVGLSYINGCFADGGTACSGSVQMEPLCVNSPEVPYLRAVLAEVEAKFCVDLGHVFLGGYSSGGWEAFTGGCAMADVLRGIVTEEGGMRNHRPTCTGPIAALMVAGEIDSTNPIGPLVMGMPYAPANMSVQDVNGTIQSLDSFGSQPGRDDILSRNGCVGTATTMYDPSYPACVQYTGCPAAYPVVWCPLPGAGHNDSSYNNVNYSPGSVNGDPLMWNFLTKLSALP